jgi:hypothetical protein
MNITKEDIITTDKYYEAFPSYYYKIDTIVFNKSITWRGNIINPPAYNQPIIISGHSDYMITDELVSRYNPKVWWGINNFTNLDNVHTLPLGITNNTNESKLHPIYGNLDQMIEVMNEPKNDINLVYMNININTYPSERREVWNIFNNKEWVTKGNVNNSLEGRKQFLREIRNHSFTLCPRGNGLDTHRLWETLYMGGIPIVRCENGYSAFKDLPICFIDSWNDVNQDFLEKEKARIKNEKWNMDKLKVGYWIEKIKDSLI